MHRRSGPRVTLDYYAQVELLPDDEFFSAVEIASLKFDRKSQASEWKRMANALRKFASRNQMSDSPGNCRRDEQGKPIRKNGKVLLLPGERSRRWRGQVWKSNLFDEDRIAIREYLRSSRPTEEGTAVSDSKPSEVSHEPLKPNFSKPFFWALAAAAIIFYFFYFRPDSLMQNHSPSQGLAKTSDVRGHDAARGERTSFSRETKASFAGFARQRRARMLVSCKIPQLNPDELVWKEGHFPEGKPFPAVYLVSLAPEPGS